MAINWTVLSNTVGPEGLDLWTVIQPYLPALARQGPEVFDGFVAHLLEKDWGKIDVLLYEKMTIEERRALEDSVLAAARQAAIARVERIQLYKDLAFKLLLRVAMMAAFG